MNWIKSKILVVLCFIAGIVNIQAQSALFIQGDKSTPIYVKVEGKMMPRQGFNYCIIPGLEAGTAQFEVLFQGNKYPVQKYNITIPESGVRGLVLTKVDEKNFALFDLQTNGYIYNNNNDDEAFLQLTASSNSLVASNNSGKKSKTEKPKRTEDVISNIDTEETATIAKTQTNPKENKETNRFIENIDLSENKSSKEKKKKNDSGILVEDKLFKSKDDGIVKDGKSVEKTPTEIKWEEGSEEPNAIPNSDCENAMNESAFESYLGSFNAQSDDESKLKYIKRTYAKRCFSSEQSGILANLMNGQSSRFELLQLLYPRVSDQSNYGRLEKLFSTAFLKKRFTDMIK